jgi:hypothetical protein
VNNLDFNNIFLLGTFGYLQFMSFAMEKYTDFKMTKNIRKTLKLGKVCLGNMIVFWKVFLK